MREFAIVSLGGVQFGLFLWPLNLMGGFILPNWNVYLDGRINPLLRTTT